jgi:hypothetical protein
LQLLGPTQTRSPPLVGAQHPVEQSVPFRQRGTQYPWVFGSRMPETQSDWSQQPEAALHDGGTAGLPCGANVFIGDVQPGFLQALPVPPSLGVEALGPTLHVVVGSVSPFS